MVADRPYGLFLCVGPAGSGKITTFHSVLGYINKADRKIWTAEDPVEITQYRLRQVQINPNIKTQDGHKYNFATAMPSFLRADPDVIMVGEMRDAETAKMGIEAALTGHLVLSTLHTNNAPDTITRLMEIGLDPFNFADVLLGIMAQRLVKKICPKYKESYRPGRRVFDQIKKDYGEKMLEKLNMLYDEKFFLYRGKGCSECNNSGLKGKTALYKFLEASDRIKNLIRKRTSADDIRKEFLAEEMTTLFPDVILKALQGHTTLEQVRKVCIY